MMLHDTTSLNSLEAHKNESENETFFRSTTTGVSVILFYFITLHKFHKTSSIIFKHLQVKLYYGILLCAVQEFYQPCHS